MEKHLYVIGNGFDIHHGINSSYRCFRDWLCENDSDIITTVEETYGCCDNEWWSDFENQLGSLDVLEYASEIANNNIPDLMSEHCDRMWNDAQIEVEQNLEGLYGKLRGCFRNWILQLSAPKRDKMIAMVIDNSLFLTFNYSKTLENLYNIPSNQILHIHGCIDDNEEFILGHGVGIDELQAMLSVGDPEPPCSDNPTEYEQWRMEYEAHHQFHQQLAEEAAVNGVASQEKPVASLLIKYKNFFDGLFNVTHVHVYGISFSKVDTPYFKRIAEVTQDAKWEFSDYEGNCAQTISSFIKRHSIKCYSIIELKNLVNPAQLKIEFPEN